MVRISACPWTLSANIIIARVLRQMYSMQRRYSVAKIDSPISYEASKPKAGGLADPRLGTMDRAMKCTTDGANVADSPGYFGHIELAKPVFHIGFISTVVKVLRCVSYHSSKLLVQPVSQYDSGSDRLIICLPQWLHMLTVSTAELATSQGCNKILTVVA